MKKQKSHSDFMKKGRKYSQEEIAVIVQSALGKTFGELNNFELKTFNKGSFGHIFEEDLTGE